MPLGLTRRFVVVIMVAVGFGVALSIVKGNGGGVRYAVGNLSAPWLLLPFIAATALARGRLLTGAVIGMLATMAALGGFYVTNAFVLDLGTHPLLVNLRLAVGAGERYFVLALISGPIFGALGGWWQRSNSSALAVLVTSLLVCEPMVWMISERASLNTHPAVWAGEAAVGVLACIAVALRPPRTAWPAGPS